MDHGRMYWELLVVIHKTYRDLAFTRICLSSDMRVRVMGVFVLLPCFNESPHIRPLIRRLHNVLSSSKRSSSRKLCKANGYQILALDDGSVDCTGEILDEMAQSYPLQVFHHVFNLGLAEAYRTLIANVLESCQDHDVVVTMDADETQDPGDIVHLLACVNAGADVVVASRYAGGSEIGVPLLRRLLSRVANWLIHGLAGIPVMDCTCGFRAFRGAVLKGLPKLESKGFEVSAELLIHVCRHNPKPLVREVPFVLHYYRKESESKMRLRQTIEAYLRLLRRHVRINRPPISMESRTV
jgi:dolichol-phosphate mannosyltransferase